MTQMGFSFEGPVFKTPEQYRAAKSLPDTDAELIQHCRKLLEEYDRTLRAANLGFADDIAEKVRQCCIKLNGGNNFAMKCEPDGGMYRMEQAVRAPFQAVPMWGQPGEFTIEVHGIPARVRYSGLFGTCEHGFDVTAVEWDKPFLSPTGYRSFLGIYWRHRLDPNESVEDWIVAVVETHMLGTGRKPILYDIPPAVAKNWAENHPA